MTVLMTTPFLVVLGGFAALVGGWTVYARAKHRGAHKAPRRDDVGYDDDWRRDRHPEAAAGEDAIAQTIAGATAAGYLGAETIPVAPVSGTPPWALPAHRDATVTLIWSEPVAEELVPLPEPGCGDCNHDPNDPRVRVICECPCHGRTGRRWAEGAETRGLAVEPGWGEPDDDENWAEVTLPSLFDAEHDLLGYAYPDGFPPRRNGDTAERYDLLFGTAPWPGGGDPASAARLDALVFELLKTPDLDADGVFELMGGDS